MTTEEEIEDFLKYFDNDVPNPEQEPIRFAHYVKLYRFYRDRKNDHDANAMADKP